MRGFNHEQEKMTLVVATGIIMRQNSSSKKVLFVFLKSFLSKKVLHETKATNIAGGTFSKVVVADTRSKL